MPLNNSSSSIKYIVGEVADFVGMPSYFSNSQGKWIASSVNTILDGALLPASVKNTLVKSSTGYTLAAMGFTPHNFLGQTAPIWYPSLHTLAATANATVIPWYARGYNTPYAMVIDSTGIRNVAITGLIAANIDNSSIAPHNGGTGGVLITSTGSKLWAWYVKTGTAFGCYSSVNDGLTWQSETLTGQAGFYNMDAVGIMSMGSGAYSYNVNDRRGQIFYCQNNTYIGAAVHCGARHLLIGSGNGNCIAQRSTNGTTWGGDETLAILGTNTVGTSNTAWWYKNGNTVYIHYGNVRRITTDGGVTWSTPSNISTGSGSLLFRINATDPAKLFALLAGGNAGWQSSDSGATWTSIAMPGVNNHAQCSLSYAGSILFYSDPNNSIIYKSINDGASWTPLTWPNGFVAYPSHVYHDGYRWYMMSFGNSPQVATSTDASTFTLRTLSLNGASLGSITHAPRNVAAIDSNTIMMVVGDQNLAIQSLDGGVTFNVCTNDFGTSSSYLYAYSVHIVVNPVGQKAFIGGHGNYNTPQQYATLISNSAATSGAKYYKAPYVTVATGARGGVTPYVKVGS